MQSAPAFGISLRLARFGSTSPCDLTSDLRSKSRNRESPNFPMRKVSAALGWEEKASTRERPNHLAHCTFRLAKRSERALGIVCCARDSGAASANPRTYLLHSEDRSCT